jgi:hypothetical protein
MIETKEPIVYRGYTDAQLHAAFDQVKDKDNWKDRISAIIDAKDQDVVDAAICYFTGGGADFWWPSKVKDRVRVRAPGYYAMIGA